MYSIKDTISKVIIYIILCLWALTTIFMLLWVVNNSFKPSEQVINHSFSVAKEFNLANYEKAFKKTNIGKAYLNSLIISGSVVIFVMLFGGMSAYILARYDFKGKKIIYGALVGSLLFPAFSTIVPVFMMMYKASFINTYQGLILPQTASNLPFAIIVLVGYMVSIPIEMEEAAYIEGSTTWKIFMKIIVPISKPSFATVAIFTFLWSYNDLFTSLVILRNKEYQPICVLLNKISSQYGTDFGLMAASVTLVVIPVLIVYLLAQKQIVKGLTAGAIKG